MQDKRHFSKHVHVGTRAHYLSVIVLVVHVFAHMIFAEESLLTEATLERLDSRMTDAVTAHIGRVREGLHTDVADKTLAILSCAQHSIRRGLTH